MFTQLRAFLTATFAALAICLGVVYAPTANAGAGVIFGTVFSGEGGMSNGLAGFSLYVYRKTSSGFQYVRNGTSGAGGNYTFYNIDFPGNSGVFKIKAAGNRSPSGYCRTTMSGEITVWNAQRAQLMVGPTYGWGSCSP